MVRHPWLLTLGVSSAAIALSAVLFLLRGRVTPEERERRRRLEVNALGRITDGVITEARSVEDPGGFVTHFLDYSYDLHGVSYLATQDISSLLAHLPRDPQRIAGPASVKYLPGNPSNSIVICEKWSGLR